MNSSKNSVHNEGETHLIASHFSTTIVSLGIEFGEIVTKANLADALQYALKQGGVEMVKRTAKSGQ